MLRDNLATYLDEVNKAGDSLIICKYNKPIAVIMPPKETLIEDDFDRK
ncbi:type II toxin-antitoxin system Phd/YefM family antitoxin [Patescibacteria group bacterium]|nr:type II toxin-antitoxin system Phd/YefM family antitoxin [Patescibacteria group bacterium]